MPRMQGPNHNANMLRRSQPAKTTMKSDALAV
jgi:hypothetical protein